MNEKLRKRRPKHAEKNNGPHPVDVYVGRRLRLRRLYLGMSQKSLARAIGLTFQQIQKYERGQNRISASRLFDLSRVLDVPVIFFFDDIPEALAQLGPTGRDEKPMVPSVILARADSLAERETVEFVKSYNAIGDRNLRRSICKITEALAVDAERGIDRAKLTPLVPGLEECNAPDEPSGLGKR